MVTCQRAVFLVLALAACGKGGGSSGKTASIDLFGTAPVPPGDLVKVKPGMTQAEVKALFPGIHPTPNHSGSPSLTIDSGYSNAQYNIQFYSDVDAVASVEVQVPTPLVKDALEKAWGPPAKKEMWPTWVNDAGYEASLMELGRKTSVSFRPFVPITADYFGPKPAPFDVLAKVKPGMTRDEIAKAAPGFEKAGAPRGNGSYIAYAGKPKDVKVSIQYDQDDKAYQYVVELPQKGAELVTKTWGPRPGKSRGLGSPMHCWDLADGTRLELDDNRLTYTTPDHSVCEVQ
ncbi:MAG: hypothetical protein ACTHU0_05795 [Kofleriaceae bacterium]